LNSSVINFITKSHSVEGGKGFGTPSMLDFLPIKRFQETELIHSELAELSREAHRLAANGSDLDSIQQEIDLLVARLLQIPQDDLQLITKVLER
jgi:hypothetical protein